MTTKSKKKRININIHVSEDNISKGYQGRLLGLITGKEFNTLLKSKRLQIKFLTTESISISDIGDNYGSLGGLRLVVAVKKIDDKEVIKQLFVSEPLSTVNHYYPVKREISFTTENGNIVAAVQSEVES